MLTPIRLYTLCTVHCSSVHSHSSSRLQQAHVALSLSISPIRESFSYFAVYSPLATISPFLKHFFTRFCVEVYKNNFLFVGERPQLSQYSIFNFCCAKYCSSCTAFSFNCADSAVQVHQPWAVPEPSVLILSQVVLTLFSCFKLCVIFRPTEQVSV